VTPFIDRLAAKVAELDAPCVVGLDPRRAQLPDYVNSEPRGSLSEEAAAVLAWNEAVIEAIAPLAPMVKPQAAFYEALGTDGFQVLRETIRCAQNAGLLVLLDVKRADIGDTAHAYARCAFATELLGADAVTAGHYFGDEGLEPFLRYARDEGRGIYVVVHSSNPSASRVQDVEIRGGGRYFDLVAECVAEWGAECLGRNSTFSSVGAVMGATYPQQLGEVRSRHPTIPLLIPGYGHQGGKASDLATALRADPGGTLVSASRSIYAVGDEERRMSRADLMQLVADRAETMIRELRDARAPSDAAVS
jgi:orotidine-5'-phosphate decarboxylase